MGAVGEAKPGACCCSWLTGGQIEGSSDEVGRSLLGTSNEVAGVAVLGDLGWRKLVERREEKKVLYGRWLAKLDKDRLVKVVSER